MVRRVALGWAMTTLAAVAADAQDSGRASDRALAPLVNCRQTADPRARATCYDAALDTLQQAVAARRVVIVDREQVAQDRTVGFGVLVPERRLPSAPRRPSIDPVEIVSTVVSVSQYGYDQWTIRIASGAVWRTIETGLVDPPKPGAEIRIRRAAMGSYMLKIGRYGHATRAIRVG
ncbi:hypothetical protein [Sphingomonas nostoxanthinifaciens]|uniref:hypothetical protein n=1 Tax=Sphingomonas nostoxanthinifaciens TaxID=2872652 RepID=UPI001CC1F8D9|nr:hypothetical protein [Sphingomonas nostoxanthinifaciens]UAK24920.1 hypothetical protein K8P63_01510 [Sphingomonas nostoxanthinifaciens]